MIDLDTVRATAERLYKALETGDADTVTEVLSPAFVGRTTAGLPLGLGGTYAGPEAMRRDFWWRLGAAFRVRAEPETYALVGESGLQVTGTYRGNARATRRPVEAAFVHLLTFDGDGIASLTQITDSAPWHAALDGAERLEAPAHPGPTVDELSRFEYAVSDGVATVVLNRPEKRNAIDLVMGEETLAVARAIAADPTVRAVLIAANGPAFTVGGDIEYFTSAPPGGLGALAGRMTEPFHEAFRILSRVEVPIVAAVQGSVAGGGLGYMYAADIVIAADDAVFTTAFSGIGLSGDGGGTWHLPRLVGAARARRMYLENLRVDAATALDWGLVAEVVPAAELREHARTLVRRLASGPTKAYAIQRRLLRETWNSSLSDQLRAETDGVIATGGTHDATSSLTAFFEKRRPTFEGR
ncbi:enoyl-CoA hydratase-related protein [Nocardioides sp. NPDC087217]|uniref:enoyl-CoA hydratase-related protein n=1 Tax=Nocardioides sp. NPDC087217 TaxID=3364335 RepID=UPI00383039AF